MITLQKTEIARQNNTLSIFLRSPKFHKSRFQGSTCLIKRSQAPHSSPVVRTLHIHLGYLEGG